MLQSFMFKRVSCICLCFIMLVLLPMVAEATPLLEEKEVYTIVIDPGHGGDNRGTISNENFAEKEITMKTAKALAEELSKYDGVEVLLTRNRDVDLSLKERAVYAAEQKADYLFSIHFNASESHTMFGTEVWIPLEAPYHTMGYQFAYLQQLEMQELGLFSRGIKNRRNDEGTDYYGIIRESVARNVPAVIIEHCYVDESRDIVFCDEDTDYEEFGKRDARAIAKFLGLEPLTEHTELFEMTATETVADTYMDATSPEICQIEATGLEEDKGILTVQVTAKDSQTPVMYYDYTMDGGMTYSKLYPWPGSDLLEGVYDESFELTLDVSSEVRPQVQLRAYNKFDLYQTSNVIMDFSALKEKQQQILPSEDSHKKDYPEWQAEETVTMKQQSGDFSAVRVVVLVLFILIWSVLLTGMGYVIYRRFRKKR